MQQANLGHSQPKKRKVGSVKRFGNFRIKDKKIWKDSFALKNKYKLTFLRLGLCFVKAGLNFNIDSPGASKIEACLEILPPEFSDPKFPIVLEEKKQAFSVIYKLTTRCLCPGFFLVYFFIPDKGPWRGHRLDWKKSSAKF